MRICWISMILWLVLLCQGALLAECYHIDTSTVTKDIRPGDFIMGTPTNPAGVALTANNYYLLKDNQPWLSVMGEMHYSRYPDRLWHEAIVKMKAGGIDIVATYCFWIHHEEIEGQLDFTGQRDLRRFVQTCSDQGLYVWLRIGPWCHGEVRNGGFPDWLVQQGARRGSNDPKYLAQVRKIYQAYYDQVQGLLYKDGGPIIGIQLDNECRDAAHQLALKKIAREVGFDVPYYTVTGWNDVHIPDKQVLPVQAGYPDDFWSRGINRNPPNEQYLFMAGIPINTGVGTDVLPVLEVYGQRTYDPADYPWLTAELGLGMQWTQRRRPVIGTDDAAALMLVKLAGGANGVGYYMYHGGSNPMGRLTPLNETGYNQCPVISYDYQAAVSEFGEIQPKYHVLKLVHNWLQQFGSDLAPMIPAMPDQRPTGVEDVETLRCMVRADRDSGYLFFNNYQRYADNLDLRDIQVQVKLGSKTVTIPAQPITIPKDSYGIWPIHLDLGGVVLEYATAQLFARIEDEQEDTYFFMAHDGIASEFVFSGQAPQVIEPGFGYTLEIPGTSNRICVLTQEQAMGATRHHLWGKPRLVVTDGALTLTLGEGLEIRSTGRPSGSLWIYPPLENSKHEGIFSRHEWLVEPQSLEINWQQQETGRYSVQIPEGSLDGSFDWILDIDHVCDYMTVTDGDRLLGDWYYLGLPYRPSLRHWKEVMGKILTFKLTPLTAQSGCYLEPRFRPDFTRQSSYAEIRDIRAIPVYRVTLHP